MELLPQTGTEDGFQKLGHLFATYFRNIKCSGSYGTPYRGVSLQGGCLPLDLTISHRPSVPLLDAGDSIMGSINKGGIVFERIGVRHALFNLGTDRIKRPLKSNDLKHLCKLLMFDVFYQLTNAWWNFIDLLRGMELSAKSLKSNPFFKANCVIVKEELLKVFVDIIGERASLPHLLDTDYGQMYRGLYWSLNEKPTRVEETISRIVTTLSKA